MDRIALKSLLRDVFTREGEGIDEAATAIFASEEDSSRVPSILFHYTTAQGLLGIIETERLWLTHTAYMNDPGEHQYAITSFKAFLRQFEDNLPKSLRRELRHLDYPLDGLRSSLHSFVASFTEDGDLLSQWRGYGALGAGYALGFDGPALAALAAGTFRDGLFRTKYIESFDGDISAQFLESFFELCAEFRIDNPGGRFLRFFSLDLFTYLARCKHPAFIEEREWRIIAWVKSGPKFRFRTVRDSLRPYVELPLKASSTSFPLRRIVCGPSTAPISGLEAVKLLLEKHGHRHVDVVASSVPFRP